MGGYYWSGDLWTGTYTYVAEAWSLTIGTSTAVNNRGELDAQISAIYNNTDHTYSIKGLRASSEFKIVNIHGQVIQSGIVTDNTLTVDLSAVEKGIYIFQSRDIAIKLIKK